MYIFIRSDMHLSWICVGLGLWYCCFEGRCICLGLAWHYLVNITVDISHQSLQFYLFGKFHTGHHCCIENCNLDVPSTGMARFIYISSTFLHFSINKFSLRLLSAFVQKSFPTVTIDQAVTSKVSLESLRLLLMSNYITDRKFYQQTLSKHHKSIYFIKNINSTNSHYFWNTRLYKVTYNRILVF